MNLMTTISERLESHIWHTMSGPYKFSSFDRALQDVAWDGVKLVLSYECDVSDPYEPGEWLVQEFQVHIFLRSHDSIQVTDSACRQVYKSIDIDAMTCPPAVLREAVLRACRAVPRPGSPNQPDTPCLEDSHPNHPRLTE